MHPRLAHNLIEVVGRSPVWCDYLFAEMNRILRPAQFWSRVFLRDLYMAWRLRDISLDLKKKENVLAVVGASHVEGVRAALEYFYKEDQRPSPPAGSSRIPFNYDSLVSVLLLEDCTAFLDIWRNLGGLPYSCSIPPCTKECAADILNGTFFPGADLNVFLPDNPRDGDNCPWHLVTLESFDEKTGDAICVTESGEKVTFPLIYMWYRGQVDPYSKEVPDESVFSRDQSVESDSFFVANPPRTRAPSARIAALKKKKEDEAAMMNSASAASSSRDPPPSRGRAVVKDTVMRSAAKDRSRTPRGGGKKDGGVTPKGGRTPKGGEKKKIVLKKNF